jgi:phenylpyruvate tautomerase PptA (4-oxalocrotonate tautomerase family)
MLDSWTPMAQRMAMPIIDIEIVGSLSATVSPGLASRLADGIGEVLSSRPQGTWVKLHRIPKSDYAENQCGAGEGVLPVFVSVLQRAVPIGEALAEQTRQLADSVASLCERNVENVHVIYQAPAPGRVAFGGVLVD